MTPAQGGEGALSLSLSLSRNWSLGAWCFGAREGAPSARVRPETEEWTVGATSWTPEVDQFLTVIMQCCVLMAVQHT